MFPHRIESTNLCMFPTTCATFAQDQDTESSVPIVTTSTFKPDETAIRNRLQWPRFSSQKIWPIQKASQYIFSFCQNISGKFKIRRTQLGINISIKLTTTSWIRWISVSGEFQQTTVTHRYCHRYLQCPALMLKSTYQFCGTLPLSTSSTTSTLTRGWEQDSKGSGYDRSLGKLITPPEKLTWNLKNHHIEMEFNLSNLHFYRFHVSFWGE